MNQAENQETPGVDIQPADPRAVLATGPPKLVLPRGDDAEPVIGELLVVDWGDLTPGINIRPGDRFQWPDAQNRFENSAFQIITTVQPDWIQVNLFAAVNAETGMPVDPQTSQPTELPVYEFECQGLEGDRRCPEVKDGIVSVDALLANPLPNEYVTVFVAWSVPFTQEEIAADPSVPGRRVFASWMFRFAND